MAHDTRRASRLNSRLMTSFAVESSVGRLRDQLRDAAERGIALRVRGGGTWMDAGRPVSSQETISVAELSGIVAYVPGDLTMTVRGGTTLAEIRDAAAAHNQWLALDPHGSADGTIGATAATASAGPLATFFGTPRDLVLGVEFVTGTGAIARGGGRVVKNVAGFDLTRLIIGSWGTIGVVTEVTVRLHARPEADRSFAIGIDEADVPRVRALLRAVPFKPYACEIVNASLAASLLGSAQTTALLRLAGNGESVEVQRRSVAELGTPVEIDAATWTKLRAVEPPGASVVRLSHLPSEIGATWRVANATGALVHASPARGVARVIASDAAALPAMRASALRSGITCVAERLPATQWVQFATQRSELDRRIKQTFDPASVLNPGILGDEA
jgi:glycolate oxidase FAD binding subunit